jgi:hypothetical protein
MVAASGDRESDGHAGFGLSSFSLLLLMLSLEMTKMMAMKACCAGGVLALAFVFSLLSTVSFLWFSLPCLPLVSSCLSFLVFPALSLAAAPPLYLLQNSPFLLLVIIAHYTLEIIKAAINEKITPNIKDQFMEIKTL